MSLVAFPEASAPPMDVVEEHDRIEAEKASLLGDKPVSKDVNNIRDSRGLTLCQWIAITFFIGLCFVGGAVALACCVSPPGVLLIIPAAILMCWWMEF